MAADPREAIHIIGSQEAAQWSRVVLEGSGLVFSDSCGAIQALRKLRVLEGSGVVPYSDP